jgi:methylated-DNA-protein-cysteine methyltransferase-like protein
VARSEERRREAAVQRILAVVGRVPRGRFATYGQVAGLAGLPGRARLVGWALRRFGAEVPWWRVLGAGGRISPRGDPDGEALQRRLLAREGLRLDARGRVPAARAWGPPGFARGRGLE